MHVASSNCQWAPLPSALVPNDELTDLDREVLDFERSWWKYPGAKDSAIRDQFDMSSTRYFQLLHAVLDKPAALEHDVLLVRRLRRLRDARRRERSARRQR